MLGFFKGEFALAIGLCSHAGQMLADEGEGFGVAGLMGLEQVFGLLFVLLEIVAIVLQNGRIKGTPT